MNVTMTVAFLCGMALGISLGSLLTHVGMAMARRRAWRRHWGGADE